MKKTSVFIPFIAVFVALMSSCVFNGNGVNVVSLSSKGFDDAPSSKVTLSEFSAIENNTPLSVDYCRSEEFSVVILGDTSKTDCLHSKVKDGKLKLELEPGVYHDLWLKVLVYAPSISSIHQNGSGKMSCDSIIGRDSRFEVVANGSGDVVIQGVGCKDVSMNINGSGSIEAKKVMAHAAKLSINGSGSILFPDLQIEENLDASVNGSGDIRVDGAAPKVKANINGSGSITGKLKHEDLKSSKMGSGNIDLKEN